MSSAGISDDWWKITGNRFKVFIESSNRIYKLNFQSDVAVECAEYHKRTGSKVLVYDTWKTDQSWYVKVINNLFYL